MGNYPPVGRFKTERPGTLKTAVFILLLGTYGLSVYLLFVLLIFPRDKMDRWMQAKFREATGADVSMEERRFVFPFGTEWRRITVVSPASPKTRFELDRFSADISLFDLLWERRFGVRFHLTGLGGEIGGNWTADKGERSSQNSLLAEGDSLDLRKFPWKTGMAVEGKVKFQAEYHWEEGDPLKGKGFFNLEGNGINGRGFAYSGFSLPEIAVSKLNAHGQIRNGVLNIDRFSGNANLADLNGAGTVIFSLPLERSLLNFSVKLIPKEALDKIMPLQMISPGARPGSPLDLYIKGSFEKPDFTLSGAPA